MDRRPTWCPAQAALRLRGASFAALLLAVGACTRDAPPAGGEAGVADDEGSVEYVEPRVTPAESAAAAVRVRSHSSEVLREAQRKAGVEPDPPMKSAPPAPAPPPQAEYEACMAQARELEGFSRTQIERACESRRRARAEGAP